MESSLFSSKPWGGGRGGCDLRSSPGRGGSLPLSWQTFSGEGQDPNVRGPWPPGGWEVRGAGGFCRGCLKLRTSEDLLHVLVTWPCSPLTRRCHALRTCLYGTSPFLFLFPLLSHSIHFFRERSDASSIFKKSNQALSLRHEQVAVQCAPHSQIPQLQI